MVGPMPIRTRWELMPTYYPAHVPKGYCLPVLVQNSDGNWCPPVTLPMFWEMLSTCPCANSDGNWCPTVTLPMFRKDTVNLSLCKTLLGTHAHLLTCPVLWDAANLSLFKTLMGTDAHLLPCQWSEKILSTCPCAKLWWELMPTCYPAYVLKRYCQPTLCKTLMGTDAHLVPCLCSEKILSTCPCAKRWWELMPTCYPCPCSEKILSTCPCAKRWWELMPTCYPAPVLRNTVNLF
jgi:hypothetical protein